MPFPYRAILSSFPLNSFNWCTHSPVRQFAFLTLDQLKIFSVFVTSHSNSHVMLFLSCYAIQCLILWAPLICCSHSPARWSTLLSSKSLYILSHLGQSCSYSYSISLSPPFLFPFRMVRFFDPQYPCIFPSHLGQFSSYSNSISHSTPFPFPFWKVCLLDPLDVCMSPSH